MPVFIDQLQRDVSITRAPRRIISLVPSQTELLYHLGLREEVIGITKFCVHPRQWFQTKDRVGGTKTIDIEKVKALAPDLIIANKEENNREQIERLAEEFPVWVSDVYNLQTALTMIEGIGHIISKEEEATEMCREIKAGFDELEGASYPLLRTLYLIWRQPYMSVGGDTFINQMLQYAGFQNVMNTVMRYPTIERSDLQELNCQLILLPSEPYPFKQEHVEEVNNLVKQSNPLPAIRLVDGETFSWYGSRLLKAPTYFKQLRESL
jgi:ABC-type Fe3+-hydroxamate transport system substrate-binding protein